MFGWISKGILAILAAIGPMVLRAWSAILRDRTGKLYAQCKGIFQDAVRHAEVTVTKVEYPDFWERMQRRIKAAYDFAAPAIARELGVGAREIAVSTIITCINAAHKELEATTGLGEPK